MESTIYRTRLNHFIARRGENGAWMVIQMYEHLLGCGKPHSKEMARRKRERMCDFQIQDGN